MASQKQDALDGMASSETLTYALVLLLATLGTHPLH